MSRWVFIFILIATTCLFGSAQQLPIFSQYSDNIGLINPSSVHTDFLADNYKLSFGLNHRSQWLNVPNSPQVSILRGEYIHNTEGAFDLLSGLYLSHDRNGQISTTGIYGRIGVIGKAGYHQSTGFSAGVLVGMVQYRVGNAADIAEDPSDPFLLEAAQSQFYPDVGFGVSFQHRFSYGIFEDDYLQIGVSAPQIFGLDVSFRNDERAFDLRREPHYYGTLQYTRMLEDDSFLEFSTWVKYVSNVPVHVDAIIKYQLSDLIWLGIGGSTTRIGHVELGLILGENVNLIDKRMRVSYSYDASFSTFFPILGAAHELSFTYSLTKN